MLIARIDSFTKAGRFVGRGQTVSEDEVDVVGDNFVKFDGNEQAVVEISAIAPTGPNPQNPQQIAPDVVQTPAGYAQSGAQLVGEVTVPEAKRFEIISDADDTTQADVTQALADADAEGTNLNVPNAGTEGTVADVSARIATLDAAGLDQLYAAENDREAPRKGVLSAIEARRAELDA